MVPDMNKKTELIIQIDEVQLWGAQFSCENISFHDRCIFSEGDKSPGRKGVERKKLIHSTKTTAPSFCPKPS